MIRVHCRTNLDDVMRIEEWPAELPERPVIGDYIQSETVHSGYFQLRLEVYNVTWTKRYSGSWELEVELYIPKVGGQPRTISEWREWYRKVRGAI